MNQNATWYGGGLGSHAVLDGDHLPKKGLSSPPPILAHVYVLSSPDFHAIMVLHGSHALHHFTY